MRRFLATAATVTLLSAAAGFLPSVASAAINPHTQTHAVGTASDVLGTQVTNPPATQQQTPPAEPRKQLKKQANPNPLDRWVLVDLSQQRIYFYQSGEVVRTNLVTTGMPGHPTNIGTWHVFSRIYNEHMSGPGYDLSNVLFTQYFDGEGEALHYAWWRKVFGVTGSHGCVNMDYSTAKFAWDFGFIGMTVRVVP
ncbi:MAG: L,D-transpeptidase family protein [Candidatus Andersenbacteria bacterium]